MAVFIDFENIATAAESRYYTLDLNRLFAELGRRGRLVLKRAYGDWSRFTKYRDELLRHGVDLVQIYSYGHKLARNRADVRMAIDAIETLFTRPEVQMFAIISGDSDFSSLITRLREHGKLVIGVGVQGATSDLIPALCDEFIYYDTLIAPEAEAVPPPSPSAPEPSLPALAPEIVGTVERYRRYLQDWGFVLLEPTIRRMGLTRLFEALRAGIAELTLARWLDRTNWEGLEIEAGGRQELGWLLLLGPALSFGPLPPSFFTPIQGVRVAGLKRFIEAAESGLIRFLGMANWPLEPEALAFLLGLPVMEVEAILRGMAREGLVAAENGTFRWIPHEDPLRAPVFENLRADLAGVTYPSGIMPSLGDARALFEEGMSYRRDRNFPMALERFRLALRMTLDLWETRTPGVGPYEIRWRAASYCSVRAGELFNNRRDFAGSLPYYYAFLALMIPGDPVWEKLRGLVDFMLHYALSAFFDNQVPVTSGPFARRLLELFHDPEPTRAERIRGWIAQVARLNPAILGWLLEQLTGVEAGEEQKEALEIFLRGQMRGTLLVSVG
ncbi:MAG: NYN domain-containing protein [Anaerolineae bacterium]|nr:NYN domain-containing protein [Thermoflexus sp.]MCS7349936.1 NYN domain-containing protein [Thermoflexus sp.]MDW8179384.1 NYN domain-containing protein [Anaerolineae bacterium]